MSEGGLVELTAGRGPVVATTLFDLAPLGADRHVKLAAYYEREVSAHIRGPY